MCILPTDMGEGKECRVYSVLIGGRLRRWRRGRKWPLKRVAAELGTTVATISNWERGLRHPSGENLVRLAHLFRQPLCALLCEGRLACPSPVCRMGDD